MNEWNPKEAAALGLERIKEKGYTQLLEKVDVNKISMGDHKRCVLAHMFKSFDQGCDALEVEIVYEACDLGFNVPFNLPQTLYKDLNKAWVSLLTP